MISRYIESTEIPLKQWLSWLGLSRGRYSQWVARHGQHNRHNAAVPKRFWLLDWEREAIIGYALDHPLEGYRRLSYMMLDADVVACSPSSVYRVLKAAGLIRSKSAGATRKGQGFQAPSGPHAHWHIDISYLNISGTFYYLCSILDGYSRYIVHWEIREQMTEADVEIVVQRAKERFPQANPRIISDNGPQFVARDFKDYIRLMGMTHVRTSAYYPQSYVLPKNMLRQCTKSKRRVGSGHLFRDIKKPFDTGMSTSTKEDIPCSIHCSPAHASWLDTVLVPTQKPEHVFSSIAQPKAILVRRCAKSPGYCWSFHKASTWADRVT
jgi:hypothetical protein